MIREFTLTNSKGEQKSLNDSNFFLHDVKGLGQDHRVTYVQIGTQYEKEKDILQQKTIQGKVRFSTYKDYENFSRFIQHKPLTMSYTSYGTYSIRVSIDKLSKSELETGGIYSDITIKSLGTYYKTLTKAVDYKEEDEVDAKIYSYVYPFTYYEVSSGSVTIESDSTLESPVRINIFGPCTNPSYTHYLNNILTASGKINATIPQGHKLVVDSTKIPYSIKEYTTDNQFVQDLYGMSDFSTERFLQMQYGINRIAFFNEESSAISTSVEVELQYESV